MGCALTPERDTSRDNLIHSMSDTKRPRRLREQSRGAADFQGVSVSESSPTLSSESASIVLVTPDMARNWLENHNEGNRVPSTRIAMRYAEVMKDGRWKVTHQGIAFDREGNLLDGQHRLKAVVLADVPVEFLIIEGCDRATFSVLDVGYRRSAGHLIDHSNRSAIASAARFLGTIDGTLAGKSFGGVLAAQADNDKILAVVDNWPELKWYAASVKACSDAAKIIPSAHLAVLAQAARTQYRGRIPAWLEGLQDGVDLSRTDPRLHLRNRFLGGAMPRSTGVGSYRVDAYGLIIRAWNVFAIDAPMNVLKMHRKEDGPPSIRV